eukprot:486153-Ditylum_brightwellii.AAC.1
MPKRGWKLKPELTWNGNIKLFKFRIKELVDSDYTKVPVPWRSSAMQKIVALSVIEVGTVPGMQYV